MICRWGYVMAGGGVWLCDMQVEGCGYVIEGSGYVMCTWRGELCDM